MDKVDRLGLAAFCLGCLFFAFLGGVLVVLTQVWPYSFFNDAYAAATALNQQRREIDNPYTQTDQWRRARTDRKGVTIYDPARAMGGYTLYTSGHDISAFLINMRGEVVHRWHRDYSTLWQTNPDGRSAQPDDGMYWRRAKMLPNGDLIAIYISAGDTPWGYGAVKLDAQSNVIWKYHGATHHDIGFLPNGDVLLLTHAFTDEKIAGFGYLNDHWLDDFVVIVDAKTGEQKTRIGLFHAFWDTRFQPILHDIPVTTMMDPLHTNSVQYIGPKLAKTFGPARGNAHQVLLSFRHASAAALLDLDTKKISWALTGSWQAQHSVRAQPDGSMTMFDNHGNFEPGNSSRVLNIDPLQPAVKHKYTGNQQHPFESWIRGEVQTLANGNRLVTESDGGRLFEIAPDGTIVWQFINPVRGGEGNQYIPVVSSGHRYKPEQLAPAFRKTLDAP